MSKNPFINAGAAAAYITAGVSLAFYVAPSLELLEDSIAAPITMLSLLVLSVAVMGYLFFYNPVVLLLEGKHAEAAKLLLTTLALFAGFVVVLVSSLIYFTPRA